MNWLLARRTQRGVGIIISLATCDSQGLIEIKRAGQPYTYIELAERACRWRRMSCVPAAGRLATKRVTRYA